LRSRFPLVILAALVVFALPAGSAFATAAGTFTAPGDGATISQGQTFTVDTNGVALATQVDFYDGAQFEGSGTETLSGSGIYTWQAQVGGWTNPTTGDNTPYGITFDAVVADVLGNTITTLYKTVTIANDVDPLTVAAVAPAADSTVSGTFTLSVTPSDPNNTVTSGDYSIEGGGTGTLASDGSGHFTASIDTVADGIPNGDVYIDVHLMDAPGNQGDNSDNILHLVVANPQAPVITPDTLVANKALYRTDETQLEVGDKVQAYGMQADGYPAPVIHYLWNLCRGQVCNGVTPGEDGLYTIQPADEGATLTLVATASNASGTDFTTVGFDVIGPAYADPFVDPTPEPVVTPPVVAPPVVAPPVVIPPVVTPPVDTTVVTPAEQKSLDVAQKALTADTKLAAKAVEAKRAAEQAAVVAKKKADGAVNKVAAPNATATEKKQVVTSVTSLIDARAAVAKKMAAAKAAAVKAAEDRDAAERAAAAAASRLAIAKKRAATGSTTTAEKKAVAAASQQAADARAAAAAKKAAADAAVAKKAAGEAAAAKQIAVAGKKVDVAITVVSAGTATATDKKQIVETVTTSVVAKTVAADKSDAAAEAAKKLAAAKKKFAAQQAAAVK
jgi:hypothetical protein